MSKDDGFDVMDVATDLHLDAKFRRVERLAPGKGIVALAVYVAVLGECWRTGERMPAADAWPTHLTPLDPDLGTVMVTVGLLDGDGQLPQGPWDDWYARALKRRKNYRERWQRGNKKRAVTARSPRGDSGPEQRGDRVPEHRRETTANRTVPYVPPKNGGTVRGRPGAREADAPGDPEKVGDILPRLRQ